MSRLQGSRAEESNDPVGHDAVADPLGSASATHLQNQALAVRAGTCRGQHLGLERVPRRTDAGQRIEPPLPLALSCPLSSNALTAARTASLGPAFRNAHSYGPYSLTMPEVSHPDLAATPAGHCPPELNGHALTRLLEVAAPDFHPGQGSPPSEGRI